MRSKLFIFFGVIISVSKCAGQNTNGNIAAQRKIVNQSDIILKTGWYNIIDTISSVHRQLDKDTIIFYIDPTPIVTVQNIKELIYYEDENGEKGLSMLFDKNGTILWKYWTNRAVGKRLAFIINDKLVYTPNVLSEISWGKAALNRGVYTKEELEAFKKLIDNERK